MQIEPLYFKEFDAPLGRTVRKKSSHAGKDEEPPAPPPPPTFTEEELAQAKRDAYQQGFLAGTQEGHSTAQNEHADTARILAATLEGFAGRVAPLFDDYRQMVLQLKQDMPALSLSIARKVAGDAISRDAAAAIEGAVLQSIEAASNEPVIAVTVHTSLAAALEQKLAGFKTARNITVHGDEQIPLADYRVEWKHGSLERKQERLWQQIEHALDSILATIARDSGQQMDLLQAKTQSPPQEEGVTNG